MVENDLERTLREELARLEGISKRLMHSIDHEKFIIENCGVSEPRSYHGCAGAVVDGKGSYVELGYLKRRYMSNQEEIMHLQRRIIELDK